MNGAESCGIYGPRTISMTIMYTVYMWVEAGKLTVEDDTCSDRPTPSVTKTNIALV